MRDADLLLTGRDAVALEQLAAELPRLADLGRRTVSFSHLPSAVLLRPVGEHRMGLGRTFALGAGALRACRGRSEPEPEARRGT